MPSARPRTARNGARAPTVWGSGAMASSSPTTLSGMVASRSTEPRCRRVSCADRRAAERDRLVLDLDDRAYNGEQRESRQARRDKQRETDYHGNGGQDVGRDEPPPRQGSSHVQEIHRPLAVLGDTDQPADVPGQQHSAKQRDARRSELGANRQHGVGGIHVVVDHDLHAGTDEGHRDRQCEDLQPVTAPGTRRSRDDHACLHPLAQRASRLRWPTRDFPVIRVRRPAQTLPRFCWRCVIVSFSAHCACHMGAPWQTTLSHHSITQGHILVERLD